MIDALPLLLGPEGYQISRSVRLRSGASAYFNRTMGAGGGTTKNVFSAWVKRGALGAQHAIFQARQDSSNQQYIGFTTGNAIEIGIVAAGSTVLKKITTAVYRDPSAWYHIFFRQDNTLATAEDRYQLWINGVRVTSWATNTNTAGQNTAYYFGTANPHYIGAYGGAGGFFDGYITEVNFVYQPTVVPDVTDFGETNPVTGVWQPKKYTGTYGTNGFYLNFSDNSAATAAAIGKDYSGNGNNWTPNNISVTAGVTYDSMLDVPTQWADGGNGRGNYCTLLPTAAGSYVTMSNGNLTVTGNTATNSAVTLSSIAVATGLFYFENTITTVGGISYIGFARMNSGYSDLNNAESFTNTNNYGGVYRNSGDVFGFGKTISSTSTFTTGDVLGLALDMDNGAVYISKNGTWLNSGVPTSGASKTGALFTWTAGTQTVCPMGGGYNGSVNNFNFGQRPFAYTPPTGFKALNTLNLPEPTILKGNQYFDVVTRSGTGSAASVSSLLFQPNAILTKLRNTAYNWYWADSERGVSKTLSTDTTAAEQTPSPALYTSFDSNGYTLGTSTGSNGLTYTYVDYLWKEGATQGFDIVTYTGNGAANRAIAHSLGVAPKMYIIKNRDTAATNWNVWFTGFTSDEYLLLNTTGAKASFAGQWGSLPTSSNFYVGSSSGINENAKNHVAYLFAEVAGFSKFGSYTGNGSADGPMVFTGFRPRYVMWKNASAVGDWQIKDSSRSTYNVTSANLYANLSNAENSAGDVDFLSNGFKLRSAGTDVNGSGNTIIYAAFAENPFKNALAR